MTNEKDERVFLETQLNWVKQRDTFLEQIENRLYEMKYISEQMASSVGYKPESEKHQLNERNVAKLFLHLPINNKTIGNVADKIHKKIC